MIYLMLFLTFFKIGMLSFGGGYGMIALIREDCLRYGWLSEEELLNFIAISESTPGPIAVNIATFVGSSQGGISGSLLATFGVVLPSFIIILLIASLFKNVLKYAGVKATLEGFRPSIVGLVAGTALTMASSLIFGISNIGSSFSFDWKGLIILGILAVIYFGYLKIKKKDFSPIQLIIISGVLGILMYGV